MHYFRHRSNFKIKCFISIVSKSKHYTFKLTYTTFSQIKLKNNLMKKLEINLRIILSDIKSESA